MPQAQNSLHFRLEMHDVRARLLEHVGECLPRIACPDLCRAASERSAELQDGAFPDPHQPGRGGLLRLPGGGGVHGARERSRGRALVKPLPRAGALAPASAGAYTEEDGGWFPSVRERGIPGAGDATRLRPRGAGHRDLGGDRTALSLQRLVATGHQHRDHGGDVPDGLPHPVHAEPDATALHLKLDELIRTTREARNTFAALENASDEELKAFQDEFEKLRSEGESETVAAITARERRLGSRGRKG